MSNRNPGDRTVLKAVPEAKAEAADEAARLRAEIGEMEGRLGGAEEELLRVREEVGDLRDEVQRASLPRVLRALADLTSAPGHWMDALVERTYWPALVPAQQLAAVAGEPNRWEITGSAPRFRLDPPFPRGWVEVRLRGKAEPAATVTLELDAGAGYRSADAFSLGALGPRTREHRTFVHFGALRGARLAPSTQPGMIDIEELSLKRVAWWRVLLPATRIAFDRHRAMGIGVRGFAGKAAAVLMTEGWSGLARKAARQIRFGRAKDHIGGEPYRRWIERNTPGPVQLERLRARVRELAYQPTFSIVVPTYNTPEKFLRACIASVRAQLYDNWELCIADDASTEPHVRRLLDEEAGRDPRIKVVHRETNGHIAAASNSALQLASGEFVALLDHDDELSPDALAEMAVLLNRHRDADFIYSDEDKLGAGGERTDPYFKPDWSPELLLNHMYPVHFAVYRRARLTEVGGFREGYEGSQDYDLCLRVTERTARVHHISKVLYHWRIHGGSAAGTQEAKPYAYVNGRRAIEDALSRRGAPGRVEMAEGYPGRYRVHYQPDTAQKVSIVIPTRDGAAMLETCLQSIFTRTTYPRFEVCVVDNGSRETRTFELFRRFEAREPGRFRVVACDIPFNFSKLNRVGVDNTDGELVLLLNNDTEVLTPGWLEELAGYAQQKEIACVGAKLLYPDDTVQHAGVVLNCGMAAHGHRFFAADAPGYFGRLLSSANYAAVTGACLMVRRAVFEELGGLDERLAVAYNDVDFCLRAFARGYRNVCLGHVTLRHFESKTRGTEDTPAKQARFLEEMRFMRERWGRLIDNDPYYSPHLAPDREDFALAVD